MFWVVFEPASSGLLSQIMSGVGGINPSLNPTQSGAIGQLTNLGAAGDPYQSQISGVANNLLGGGGANNYAPLYNAAYQQYANQIMPTASGQNVDPNTNPFFQNTTNTIQRMRNVRSKGSTLVPGSIRLGRAALRNSWGVALLRVKLRLSLTFINRT